MTQETNQGRLQSIDVGRGLAALSVATYHFGVGKVLSDLAGWHGLALIEWPGSHLAVPFFFVISGFCIHLGGLSRPQARGFTRRFLVGRLFRIYPPWLFAVLLSAAVFRLGGRWPSPRVLLSHLTLTNGFLDDYELNPVLWSVSVEFCLYLLYPAWLPFRRRFGCVAAGSVAFAASAASCLATAYWHPEVSGPAMWFFLNVWCGWIAGAMVAEVVHAERLDWLRRTSFWIAGGVGVSLHVLLIEEGAYTGPLAFFRLPISICFAVWPLSGLLLFGEFLPAAGGARILSIAWAWMARIGLFSYSLYLLHVPLESLRFPVNNALEGFKLLKGLLFLAWFFLVLAASWCSYRWLEIPSINAGRRLLNRRPAPA